MEALHATRTPIEVAPVRVRGKQVAKPCSIPISSVVFVVVAVAFSAFCSAAIGYHASSDVLRAYTQGPAQDDMGVPVIEISTN